MRNVAQQGGESYLEVVLEYLIEQGKVRSQVEFIDLIRNEVSAEVGEKIMSLREMFLQEGLKKGLQEGRLEGRLEGRQEGIMEGAVNAAKRMLALKLDLDFIANVTQLPITQIKQIEEALR